MILFHDFVALDKSLWFHDIYGPGIYKLDVVSHQLSLENILKGDVDEKRKYGRCFVYKQKILFLPLNGNNIIVYDRVYKKSEEVILPIVIRQNNDKFFPYIIKDSRLFLFPWRCPFIIMMDLDTYDVKIITDWIDSYKKYETNTQLTFFRKDVLVDGEFAFLVTWQAPIIFKYNLNTLEYEFIEINNSMFGFSTICKGDNRIILTDKTGEIYISDLAFNYVEKLCCDAYKNKYIFFESFFLNGKIWLVGARKKVLVSIDTKTLDVEYIRIDEEQTTSRIICAKPYNEKDFLIQLDNGYIYIYYSEQKELKEVKIDKKHALIEGYNNVVANGYKLILNEQHFSNYGLDVYLAIIKDGCEISKKEDKNLLVGKQIIIKMKEDKNES